MPKKLFYSPGKLHRLKTWARIYRNNTVTAVFVSLLLPFFCGIGQNAGKLAIGRSAMVSSASPYASRVGLDILRQGGNAVDAAVAMGFALAVTYPSAGNLGGSTYLIIRMADGREAAIDAREVAPLTAARDMYLDSEGEVIGGLSTAGALAAGVPGTVDGLLTALKDYGTLSREQALAPAIHLAKHGFAIHERLAALFRIYESDLRQFPSSEKVFFNGADTYTKGDIWKQPELAATLQRISDSGRAGFYSGTTADLIAAEMEKSGGIINHRDLEEYTCITRKPVRGAYKGYDILSMPPSSSGGVVLIQILNMLEQFDVGAYNPGDPEYIHILAECMRRAFADRASKLGDPAFVDIDVEKLISKEYAQAKARSISMTVATPSEQIGEKQLIREGMNTTHYSVADKFGNVVSVTTTINSTLGSKLVVDGAGFLLNNEMDDFSIKPGIPNQYGLVEGDANAIEPGKRMLSSMTPTVVLRNEKPVMVAGSPGGPTIITAVLQVILNILEHNMLASDAAAAKRIHHQWVPDQIRYESGALTANTQQSLQEKGHILREVSEMGRIDLIVLDPVTGMKYGCSDPRGYGAALGY
ncbi:MAG: gamma-glutamyltransferase [Ectothiorhodospiraceae bacterium]|nr:gamma-glutamyltransferase [Ectothiorhodospiraceae bacterium]